MEFESTRFNLARFSCCQEEQQDEKPIRAKVFWIDAVGENQSIEPNKLPFQGSYDNTLRVGCSSAAFEAREKQRDSHAYWSLSQVGWNGEAIEACFQMTLILSSTLERPHTNARSHREQL